MFTTVLTVVAVLIAGVLLVAATRSSACHVVRSTTLTAPPSAVFRYMNDLRKFQEWSPWAKLDPSCQVTFDGPLPNAGLVVFWAATTKSALAR